MRMFGTRLAAVTAVTAAIALVVSVGAASASTSARSSTSATCLSDNGTDVQRYFDIRGSDAIWLNLQGHQPACVTVTQGRTFYRTHGWIAQVPSRAVFPAGYEPDFASPMADFLSKISQARYVISRDGEVEMTRTVRGRALFAHAKLGRFGDLFVAPDTTLVPGVTIGGRSPEWTTLEPFDSRSLGVGEHTIEIHWTLTEPHCDGFAPDPTISCLRAGESLSTSTTFTVIPRH